MIEVVSVAEMAKVDERLEKLALVDKVIEEVGRVTARRAVHLLGKRYGKRVAVIAGPGNNGRDGVATASSLSALGVSSRVLSALSQGIEDELRGFDLVVDAAFGSGLKEEYYAPHLDPSQPVLSIDVPSGVDAESGEILGRANECAMTLAVGALKPGLIQGAGSRLSKVTEIGLGYLAPGDFRGSLFEDSDILALLPQKSLMSHKWNSAVMVIAGSPGTYGAASMACSGALRGGAGMVHLYAQELNDTRTIPDLYAEVVVRSLDSLWAEPVIEAAARFGAIVVGPGVGTTLQVANFVRRIVVGTNAPLVLDADAITCFGDASRLARAISSRKGPVVITPHAGEFDQLFESYRLSSKDPDKGELARKAAQILGAVVSLKGSPGVVADPSGRCIYVTSGSSRLSVAGSGDVLSGVIGGFLAMGVSPLFAASAAAHVHGRAAEMLSEFSIRPMELGPAISRWLGRLSDDWHPSHSISRPNFAASPLPGWASLLKQE